LQACASLGGGINSSLVNILQQRECWVLSLKTKLIVLVGVGILILLLDKFTKVHRLIHDALF